MLFQLRDIFFPVQPSLGRLCHFLGISGAHPGTRAAHFPALGHSLCPGRPFRHFWPLRAGCRGDRTPATIFTAADTAMALVVLNWPNRQSSAGWHRVDWKWYRDD
jgi:hypothetical protein